MGKKILLTITILLLVGIVAGLIWIRRGINSGELQKSIIEKVIVPQAESADTSAAISKALGMDSPRTYLALFINNTELRPGGGFIGSYAVVQVDKGKPHILKVEGTEILDNNAPGIGDTPPLPMSKLLKIKTWQFRDSNWSPDFSIDARKALDFYKRENGAYAADISGVIAFTPSLFEEIVKITGPVTVDGIEFNSQNFTETLEYEVEYGYSKRGQDFSQRKSLLTDLAHALLPRLISSSLTHWPEYTQLIPKMLNQKQILIYSTDPEEELQIENMKWGGTMNSPEDDYLLWADANLGSLKTDVAITRNLSYSINVNKGDVIATAKMNYAHGAPPSWRISTYRDYVRIFVPVGSKFVSLSGGKGFSGDYDEGDENGFHWFGAYMEVKPQESKELSFTYRLPGKVAAEIANGSYKLNIQKQSGTKAVQLTLGLGFDKNLAGASPPEPADRFGDTKYDLKTDLSVDRSFEISLKK